MNPIKFDNSGLHELDQRILPFEEKWISINSLEGASNSIREMTVRGAPLIGFTAIYGMALWLKNLKQLDAKSLTEASQFLKSARPTAVNLMFEVDKIVRLIQNEMASGSSVDDIYLKVVKVAQFEIQKLETDNLKMASYALEDLRAQYSDKKLKLMTHCNTGRLACGCIGTALGVIVQAQENKMLDMVWVDETRPYLQGSRLTSFELFKENIPHQIVVEGAASYLMSRGLVDAVFVGADRIALNGDTANKIGTATLAIVANFYKVPFYVVAPLSSFDFNIQSGKEIEIELRHEEEILSYKGQKISHPSVHALNPSFDVTPSELITGIICEKGIIKHPTINNMKELRG